MRNFVCFVFIMFICLVFSGCNNSNAEPELNEKPVNTAVKSSGPVEIREKLFIQQCNDVYENMEDYIGRTIKIEGLCEVWDLEEEGMHYVVYRKTPGCCGDDGMIGFGFKYSGDMPEKDDWIEVEGEIVSVSDADGYLTPEIRAARVIVKEERGEEFVNN